MDMNNSLINKLNKYYKNIEVVSFDFYDTLMLRDVSKPSEVFDVVEYLYNKKNDSKVERFKEARINAEKDARVSSGGEITIDDIYNNFPSNFSVEELKDLRENEIFVERNICYPNKEIVDCLLDAKKNNKKVIVTSDFYIGKSHIETVLKKHSIEVDDIFVSCDYKKTKSEGDLFNVVIKKTGVNPSKILHIGDNYTSDVKSAKRKDLNSIYYKRNSKTKEEANLIANYTYNFINNRLQDISGANTKYGYKYFGPLLYGFCKWLQSSVEEKRINKIYFLSRDGLIIKNAFDLINNNNNIKTYYFYASRRALLLPAFDEMWQLNDVLNRYAFGDYVTLKHFYNLLGIEDDEIETICLKYNLNLIKKIDIEEYKKNNIYKEIFIELKPTISKVAKEEKENFIEYSKKMDFTGECAIVDIGWFGNMQSNLINLTTNTAKIHGYYIGVDPDSTHARINDMHGYLFDADFNQDYRRMEKRFNSVFELIFSANHGSVLKYFKGGEVILKDNEHTGTDEFRILGDFQKGALKFVEEYNNSSVIKRIDKDQVLDNLFKFFMIPDKEMAKEWLNLVMEDGEVNKMGENNGPKYYLTRPIKFFKDLKSSQWKVGFLTMNTPIKFKYYKLHELKDILKGF